jgi:2-oxoglutarate/2-oxoacid ferredoxin oxidoreductase subunit alpha
VDVADIFGITVEAFNIAEQYQTPVIVLSDGDIGQRKETVERFDPTAFPLVERRRPTPDELSPYVRFRITESGVSPISEPGHARRQLPGVGHRAHRDRRADRHRQRARGDDRQAHTQARSPEEAARPVRRIRTPLGAARPGELGQHRRRRGRSARVGAAPRDCTSSSWCRSCSTRWPRRCTATSSRRSAAGLVVEQSYLGQLWRLLKMFVDVPAGVEPFARPGAVPISPDEIVARLRQLAATLQRQQAPEPAPVE